MTAPRIIGLSGYAGAGKDTVANCLGKWGYERIAFADMIKEVALAIDPTICTPRMFLGLVPFLSHTSRLADLVDDVGWERAKKNPDVRRFLQRLGTEGGREILGEGIWADAVFSSLDPEKRYVITDVRFKNEAQAIMRADGAVVRVERAGVHAANNHKSETELDYWGFHYTIRNDRYLSDLYRAVDRMYESLCGVSVST